VELRKHPETTGRIYDACSLFARMPSSTQLILSVLVRGVAGSERVLFLQTLTVLFIPHWLHFFIHLTVRMGVNQSDILLLFHQVKVKVKLPLCLTKHHAMKAYWESGGIAPRIF